MVPRREERALRLVDGRQPELVDDIRLQVVGLATRESRASDLPRLVIAIEPPQDVGKRTGGREVVRQRGSLPGAAWPRPPQAASSWQGYGQVACRPKRRRAPAGSPAEGGLRRHRSPLPGRAQQDSRGPARNSDRASRARTNASCACASRPAGRQCHAQVVVIARNLRKAPRLLRQVFDGLRQAPLRLQEESQLAVGLRCAWIKGACPRRGPRCLVGSAQFPMRRCQA